MEILLWHILPPVHHLMADSAASPGQCVCVFGLGKFLKLPTSRPDGHVLFSTGIIIWPLSFFLSIGLEDIVAHIEAFTKFTQQALNDSWQNLSLLNTEMSLMRKAVFQNWMALDIITPLKGGTCAIIQNIVAHN